MMYPRMIYYTEEGDYSAYEGLTKEELIERLSEEVTKEVKEHHERIGSDGFLSERSSEAGQEAIIQRMIKDKFLAISYRMQTIKCISVMDEKDELKKRLEVSEQPRFIKWVA